MNLYTKLFMFIETMVKRSIDFTTARSIKLLSETLNPIIADF